MNHLLKITCHILFSVIFLAILHACKKTTLPVLTTFSAIEITDTSAVAGGNISDDGGSEITFRGICYSTSPQPTINDERVDDEEFIGRSFLIDITWLIPSTNYFVRAFATNSEGTSYGNEVVFRTYLADVERNLYKTVEIGTQVWMAENLKTTRLNDGTSIQETIDWEVTLTPGYCWYNNDIAANKGIYGALYTYNTAISGNLCPSGWHVPDAAEWDTLVTFLGGKSVAGGKLKESGSDHWNIGNTGTNDFGFTALPGGLRGGEYPSNFGEFGEINERGVWWSTTKDYKYNYKIVMYIDYNSNSLNSAALSGYWGFSVRCLQN